MNAEECHSIPPTSKRFRRDMWNSDEMSEMSVSIFCCSRKPFETFWQLLIFAWVTPVQIYKVHIHSIDEYTVHACMHLCIYITTCSSAKRGTSCCHLESLRLFVRRFSATVAHSGWLDHAGRSEELEWSQVVKRWLWLVCTL